MAGNIKFPTDSPRLLLHEVFQTSLEFDPVEGMQHRVNLVYKPYVVLGEPLVQAFLIFLEGSWILVSFYVVSSNFLNAEVEPIGIECVEVAIELNRHGD